MIKITDNVNKIHLDEYINREGNVTSLIETGMYSRAAEIFFENMMMIGNVKIWIRADNESQFGISTYFSNILSLLPQRYEIFKDKSYNENAWMNRHMSYTTRDCNGQIVIPLENEFAGFAGSSTETQEESIYKKFKEYLKIYIESCYSMLTSAMFDIDTGAKRYFAINEKNIKKNVDFNFNNRMQKMLETDFKDDEIIGIPFNPIEVGVCTEILKRRNAAHGKMVSLSQVCNSYRVDGKPFDEELVLKAIQEAYEVDFEYEDFLKERESVK